jgi:hypothetical protein
MNTQQLTVKVNNNRKHKLACEMTEEERLKRNKYSRELRQKQRNELKLKKVLVEEDDVDEVEQVVKVEVEEFLQVEIMKEKNKKRARDAYRLKKGIDTEAPLIQRGGARNIKHGLWSAEKINERREAKLATKKIKRHKIVSEVMSVNSLSTQILLEEEVLLEEVLEEEVLKEEQVYFCGTYLTEEQVSDIRKHLDEKINKELLVANEKLKVAKENVFVIYRSLCNLDTMTDAEIVEFAYKNR